MKESGQPSWAALHNRRDNQYRNDNPKLPTLDPWVLRNKPPAERFVFTRNPYYYRVDEKGQQLPYADQVVFDIADSKLIPAKAGAGDSDLQARNIRFDNYTFLKESEEQQQKFWVRLWDDGRGSKLALNPNLTANDVVWRGVLRDVRCRRALSMAIDRDEINQAIYYGLGVPGANTVLQQSPLYKPEYTTTWSTLDLDQANALLDEMGLTKRGQRQFPPAAGRQTDGDHRRHGGRKHGRDRRAAAGARFLAQDRHRSVLQALGARGLPQPHLRRQFHHVGLVPGSITASPTPT